MPSSAPLPARVIGIAAAIFFVLATTLWLMWPGSEPTESSPAIDGVDSRTLPDPMSPDNTGPAASGEGVGEAGRPGSGSAADQDAAPEQPPGQLAVNVETELATLRLFLLSHGSLRPSTVIRRVQAPMTVPAQAQVALEQLRLAGGGNLISPLPAEAKAREIWVSPAGIAYVDFPSEMIEALPHGSLAEIQLVYGVIGTLTASFPNIRSVQFLIDGLQVDSFTGHLDLSRPLLPLADWIY